MNGWDLEEIRDILLCDLGELVPKNVHGLVPSTDAASWSLDVDLADTLYSSKEVNMTMRQRRASELLRHVGRCGLALATLRDNTPKTESQREGLQDGLQSLLDGLPDAVRRYTRYVTENEARHLLMIVQEEEKIPAEKVLKERSPYKSGNLPWGKHETQLLRKLALAADRFWKLYDPSDPATAPTNQQVIDWLKGQGVSERTAEVMATILRADGLPSGPRK